MYLQLTEIQKESYVCLRRFYHVTLLRLAQDSKSIETDLHLHLNTQLQWLARQRLVSGILTQFKMFDML